MLSQVSFFNDHEESEYLIDETIDQNLLGIQNWLSTTRTRLEYFERKFPYPTGIQVNDRGAPTMDSAIDIYSVRIILKPSQEDAKKGVLVSAYPVESSDRSIRNRYPMLSCLFGAYFNQEWNKVDKDPSATISDFINDASPNETAEAIIELKNLLKESHTEEEWHWLLTVDFGCSYFLHQSWAQTTDWLEEEVLSQLETEKPWIPKFLKNPKLSKQELVELVDKIARGKYYNSEKQRIQVMSLLEKNFVDPYISDYIFHKRRKTTAEEIVERALAYKVLLLPSPPDMH